MLQTDGILGLIPARLASTRFPGKPLALIHGIPMVIRVYQNARKALNHVFIASSDPEIGEVAARYGAGFILTRPDHLSGTSRCIEAFQRLTGDHQTVYKTVINIQGDEPLVDPEAIRQLADDSRKSGSQVSTLIRRESDDQAFRNPNRVKVVTDRWGNALYFSRSPVPYYRNPGNQWFSHVGMYAFKSPVLRTIMELDPGPLEKAESLEQLTWLENGLSIHCCETAYPGFGVDTPEDLEKLLKAWPQDQVRS